MAGGSRRLFFLFIIFFFADRAAKWYAMSLPASGPAFSLGQINIGYYLNPSLFFFPAWRWIPWAALVILILLTTYYLLLTTSARNVLLPIMLGGASNVFDRFTYGGVIDYVEIFGLATINIADILILLGLLAIIIKNKKLPPIINRSTN